MTIKEASRRERILQGNLWVTVLYITAPLALYALFNFLYGFFDLVIVSTIGTTEAASVVFIDEIKAAILAFGGGIAAGGSVIVARFYGAGDMASAKKNAGASFAFALVFSSLLAVLLVLFGKPLLQLVNAPTEVIEAGLGYYNIQIISTALMAVNSVYFGLEKAKGNSAMILYLNIVAMVVKLALSVLFVFGLDLGMTYVALATLLSQGVLMVFALFVLFHPKNSLRVEWKELSLSPALIRPIFLLALPVMAGKFLFSMGRVIVNGMAAVYGPLAVAALGVAIRVTQAANSIPLVFEESETAIVSQNIGAKQLKRAFQTNRVSHVYAFVIGLIGMVATLLVLDQMVNLFVPHADPVYRQMIIDIYHWEKFSTYTSIAIAIVTGLFIGFKMTRVSFVLNVIRLYVFRIPLLFILQKVGVGYISLGYIMFFSNLATTLVALTMLFLFYRKVKNYGYMGLKLQESEAIS